MSGRYSLFFLLVLKKSPENPKVNFFLGISLLLQGNPDKSIKYLEKVIELNSESFLVESHRFLGKAYLKKGKIDKARKHFKMVIKLEQKNQNKKYTNEAEEILKQIK